MRFSALSFRTLESATVRHSGGPYASVKVLLGGREVLYLYPWPYRVVSACFVYTLTANELRFAVDKLRTVTGGLEGWIVPALEWTQKDLGAVKNLTPVRRELLAAIPALLESCRDLPVSEVWRRHRRETQKAWVEHLRTHPEEISEVTAPWMLPDGYDPPLPTSKSLRSRRRRSRSSAP